jgi:hypothetical protein
MEAIFRGHAVNLNLARLWNAGFAKFNLKYEVDI